MIGRSLRLRVGSHSIFFATAGTYSSVPRYEYISRVYV